MQRLLLTLVGTLGLGCQAPSEAPPHPSPAAAHHPHAEAPATAPRVDAKLAELAAILPENLPHLGLRELAEARRQFATLPPQAPPPVQVDARLSLAHWELIAGEVAIAQRLLGEAALLLEGAPPEAAPRIELLRFTQGVAALREGEQRNCQAHHGPRSCILPLEGDGVHADAEPARRAMQAFQALVRTTPNQAWNHHTSRWLLNIAAMAAGVWPDALAPEDRVAWPTEPFPRFPNVASALGVDSFDHAGGAVADDFDGDGHFDLVSSSYHPRGQLRYWHNDGQGGFVDQTAAAGLTGQFGGLNVVHADYDNDGDLDLLVLRGAWLRDAGRQPQSLLRNDHGIFTDVTEAAGLRDRFPTQTAAWADCDLDGDLDLYVGGEAEATYPGLGSHLYRNDGGVLVDITAHADVANDRYAKGVAWGDYDEDRWPDLYVSNLHATNRLYHNRGDCTFEDVAARLGVEAPQDSFATWFWDANNDGHLDLMVLAYLLPQDQTPDHLWYVAASHTGDPNPAPLPRLYLGDGHGGFTDVSVSMGIAQATLPMGAALGDLDQDGWLDFYLGTGSPDLSSLVPNVMYHNIGGTRFANVTGAGGFGHLQKGHGIAFADLDNDGDQDIWEQMGGFFQNDAFFNALYENPGFQRHWIDIELEGHRSNRFGVGARITVEAGGRVMYRTVGFGSSFGSRPMRENIGLDQADHITRLTIWWPASNTQQVFTPQTAGELLRADGFLHIVEGEDHVTRVERTATPLRSGL